MLTILALIMLCRTIVEHDQMLYEWPYGLFFLQ